MSTIILMMEVVSEINALLILPGIFMSRPDVRNMPKLTQGGRMLVLIATPTILLIFFFNDF